MPESLPSGRLSVKIDVAELLDLPEDERREHVEVARELLRRCLTEPDEVRVALFKRALQDL